LRRSDEQERKAKNVSIERDAFVKIIHWNQELGDLRILKRHFDIQSGSESCCGA
jgi:hypothetical protein